MQKLTLLGITSLVVAFSTVHCGTSREKFIDNVQALHDARRIATTKNLQEISPSDIRKLLDFAYRNTGLALYVPRSKETPAHCIEIAKRLSQYYLHQITTQLYTDANLEQWISGKNVGDVSFQAFATDKQETIGYILKHLYERFPNFATLLMLPIAKNPTIIAQLPTPGYPGTQSFFTLPEKFMLIHQESISKNTELLVSSLRNPRKGMHSVLLCQILHWSTDQATTEGTWRVIDTIRTFTHPSIPVPICEINSTTREITLTCPGFSDATNLCKKKFFYDVHGKRISQKTVRLYTPRTDIKRTPSQALAQHISLISDVAYEK